MSLLLGGYELCVFIKNRAFKLSVFTAWDINGGKLQILQLIDNDRSKKALQI